MKQRQRAPHRRPRRRTTSRPTARHGIRSWLGVPLFMYGECEGVIAVQSSARRRRFGAEHQRLLESLALQIAAALQNAHLYELAMVDGLTGLFVRRYFDARIEEEIERSKRYGTPFSVVMMDVDDFKKLNDTYGHLVGDRVLRAIANVVKAQMRGVDTAARYGGEEIAVILPRTEMVGAYNLAERIRDGDRRAADHDRRRAAAGAAGDRVARHRGVSRRARRPTARTSCGAPTARCIARRRPARTASSCSGATTRARRGIPTLDRELTSQIELTTASAAERKVGWARLWARAKQVLTTDPSGSDDDDHVVDEEAARALAAQAGRLKGGLAKVAQLAAYDPGATLGAARRERRARGARRAVGSRAGGVGAAAIAEVVEAGSRRAAAARCSRAGRRRRSRRRRSARSTRRRSHDGTEVVVKVQYPGVADALRADLDDDGVRAQARGRRDRRARSTTRRCARSPTRCAASSTIAREAAAQTRFAAAWAGDAALRVPRVIGELSSAARADDDARARARPSSTSRRAATPDVRRAGRARDLPVRVGLAARARPAQRRSEPRQLPRRGRRPTATSLVWCLDFGCALELPDDVRDADRELWCGAARRRRRARGRAVPHGARAVGPARAAPTRSRPIAHRDWERALARRSRRTATSTGRRRTRPSFADATGRALAAGGLRLPARRAAAVAPAARRRGACSACSTRRRRSGACWSTSSARAARAALTTRRQYV